MVGTCRHCGHLVAVTLTRDGGQVVAPHPGRSTTECEGTNRPPRGHL